MVSCQGGLTPVWPVPALEPEPANCWVLASVPLSAATKGQRGFAWCGASGSPDASPGAAGDSAA